MLLIKVKMTVRNLFCCHMTVKECTEEDLRISPSGLHDDVESPSIPKHLKRDIQVIFTLFCKYLYIRLYNYCPLPSFCRVRPSWRRTFALWHKHTYCKKNKQNCCILEIVTRVVTIGSSLHWRCIHLCFSHDTWRSETKVWTLDWSMAYSTLLSGFAVWQ